MKKKLVITILVFCLLFSACAQQNAAHSPKWMEPTYLDLLDQTDGEVLSSLGLRASDVEFNSRYTMVLPEKTQICSHDFSIELCFDGNQNENRMYGFRYCAQADLDAESCCRLLQEIAAALTEAYGAPKTAPMEGRLQDMECSADFSPEVGAFDRWLVPGEWTMTGYAGEDVILRAQLSYYPQHVFREDAAYIVLDFSLCKHKLVSYELEHGIVL